MRTSLRRRELTLAAMTLTGTVDAEDTMVDFSNVSLYLSGLQTVFAVVTVACVSVLSCWIVPEGGVSAVRTLALCTATGALLMRTPLRVGRAHGVNVVFSSLQPAIPIYILALTVEQLVHTCATETQHSPSWRRVVFHGMILVMCGAGILRARHPMRDTDIPFLVTAGALLTIAVLPPPSVALMGPLCQPVTAWEAAERCLRALVFAMLYCMHVYSSISSSSLTRTESLVIITRSAAAAIWAMGAHVLWLPASIVQGAIVIMARFRVGHEVAYQAVTDRPLSATSDDEEANVKSAPEPSEMEYVRSAAPEDDPVEHQRMLLAEPHHGRVTDSLFARTVVIPPPPVSDRRSPSAAAEEDASVEVVGREGFGPLRFREVQTELPHHAQSATTTTTTAGGGGLRAEDMTAERMRDIVYALETEAAQP